MKEGVVFMGEVRNYKQAILPQTFFHSVNEQDAFRVGIIMKNTFNDSRD